MILNAISRDELNALKELDKTEAETVLEELQRIIKDGEQEFQRYSDMIKELKQTGDFIKETVRRAKAGEQVLLKKLKNER